MFETLNTVVDNAPLIVSRGSGFGDYRYIGVWDGHRQLTALIVTHDGQIIHSTIRTVVCRPDPDLARILLDKLLDRTLGFADTA